jgi:hypothetical protein
VAQVERPQASRAPWDSRLARHLGCSVTSVKQPEQERNMIANLSDEDLCLVHGGATYVQSTWTSPNTSVVVSDVAKQIAEFEAILAAIGSSNSEGS